MFMFSFHLASELHYTMTYSIRDVPFSLKVSRILRTTTATAGRIVVLQYLLLLKTIK